MTGDDEMRQAGARDGAPRALNLGLHKARHVFTHCLSVFGGGALHRGVTRVDRMPCRIPDRAARLS
jgi:hypothetical protein